MDVYGNSAAPELFRIDDLLDFSNDELFSSSSAAIDAGHGLLPADNSSSGGGGGAANAYYSCGANFISSGDFPADDLCVPSDEAAELEWLSQFVDDSFTDFPASESPAGDLGLRPESSFHGRSRSKRTRAVSAWISPPESNAPVAAAAGTPKGGGSSARKKEISLAAIPSGDKPLSPRVRRCTHCASEKTPQWRTGPQGPKTLCNACGVRYKSGRLVPEYRPAASPTFVLTQHSNSHRKVMELRRQKEILRQDKNQKHPQQHQFCHHQNYEVC